MARVRALNSFAGPGIRSRSKGEEWDATEQEIKSLGRLVARLDPPPTTPPEPPAEEPPAEEPPAEEPADTEPKAEPKKTRKKKA